MDVSPLRRWCYIVGAVADTPVWVLRQIAGWTATHPRTAAYIYAGTTGFMIGNPATRTFGIRMGSYGIRAGLNMTRGALGYGPGLMRTTFVRGGSRSLATAARGAGIYAGAAALGYAIGATVGTGIAYAGWGEKGARDALDLYSGQVSISEYFTTVGKLTERFS